MRGLYDIFAGGKIRKKAVLLYQFGVLHDGKDAYPGAIEAVDRL